MRPAIRENLFGKSIWARDMSRSKSLSRTAPSQMQYQLIDVGDTNLKIAKQPAVHQPNKGLWNLPCKGDKQCHIFRIFHRDCSRFCSMRRPTRLEHSSVATTPYSLGGMRLAKQIPSSLGIFTAIENVSAFRVIHTSMFSE